MNNTSPRALVVDDELHQRSALASILKSWGYQVQTAGDGQEALGVLADFDPDVIVTDLQMPNLDGKGLLAELHKNPNGPPAIVLTAFGNLETALETVLELGAFWFLEKPLQPAALKLILGRALDHSRLVRHADRMERQLSSQGLLGDLVGGSGAMQGIFSLLRQVAPTSATVLITGESGTGKEMVARAIHELSPRRVGPFVAINCAALPETLIESELFGHEKGSFTGAAERRAGCFELARGGTLLLDEIGDMPLSTQSKLLRVLEDRKVRRLGSSKETDLDVRVLAATNHNLLEAIRKNTFREDLYFRLNVFEVMLPALRDRMEDLSNLCSALIVELNRKHGCKVTDIEPAVSTLFKEYGWPGNVRELRNILERAVILAGTGTIRLSHLPRAFGGVEARVTQNGDSESPLALRPGMTIDEAERALIAVTLEHTGNNRTRAAEILGISTKTLFNKLKEYESRI